MLRERGNFYVQSHRFGPAAPAWKGMNYSTLEGTHSTVAVSLAKADQRIRDIHDYSCAKRGDRILPLRRDFDHLDIPGFLANVILVDVRYDPDGVPDFFYRLVGTREVAARGRDPTGRRVADACRGPSAEDALDCYRRVVNNREPHVDIAPFEIKDRRTRDIGNIFLPFSEDGERVSRILVYTVFEIDIKEY